MDPVSLVIRHLFRKGNTYIHVENTYMYFRGMSPGNRIHCGILISNFLVEHINHVTQDESHMFALHPHMNLKLP